MCLTNLSARHPAEIWRTNAFHFYRIPVLVRIHSLLQSAKTSIFGCSRKRTSLPLENQQTCLNCGANRSYIFGLFEVEVGNWEKAVR